MFRSIFLLCVCCLGYPLVALWAQNAVYEKITIEQGLSQGMIFDIEQTRDGFLWVATKDGLNRYDGYNFKLFANNPFDPFSLAQNSVNALFEDSRGLLWIGLDSKGLDVFDPKTGRFHHFPLDYKSEIIVHGTEVRRITELPDGSICVLKLGVGLIRIAVPEDWKNGLPAEPWLEKLSNPTRFTVATDAKAQPFPEAILDMALLRNGNLLVTSNHRQYLIVPSESTVQVINPGLTPFGSRWIAQGDEAFGGDLWVGQGQEIRCLRNGAIQNFFPPGAFCLLTLRKGKKGHVWLSLCGELWDLEPGEDPDFLKPDLAVDATITCVEQDRNGNLWLGTNGYGLRKVNVVSRLFHSGGQGLSPSGLWRSTTGRYFGKEITIIKEYFPATGQFAATSFFSKTPLDQLGLAFEPDGSIWLLCKEITASNEAMLKRFTPEGRLLKTFVFEAKIGNFDNLLRLRNGQIIVGAGNCRLVRFDPTLERFEYFSFAHLFGEKTSSVRVVALSEDERGTLWVGTQMGLVKCNLDGLSNKNGVDSQLFEANPANPAGLNNNSIASILPTPDGQIWLGTKGGGINVLNPQTGECRHITTADGLLNNVVYGILPGNRPGEFWCSTNRGLAKIMVLKNEPFEYDITTFTAAVGLQDNEFNTNAYFKADNGELLFGGVNGLNRFFPEELRPDTVPPSVYLIGLEINRKKADFGLPGSPLSVPLEMTRHIELAYDQNNISFEFAALDLTDPSKNRYRYRLVGLEGDWVEAGVGRFAHYSHLPSGHYKLLVQGSNGESAWRDAPPVTLIVHPPWYRSALAYFCYVLLLGWVVWRAYRFQIVRVKERGQLAFEQRETERVKALEQLKSNFFSNITHEFRTPLSLILEPARQLLKNPQDPLLTDKIRLIEKHGRRLQRLVNQLLDMAKLEAGQMPLELRRGDFGAAVREVFEVFLPLAEQRGVKMTLSQEQRALDEVDFDPGKIELILNNLLSNALKFTPSGGKVEINIAVAEAANAPALLKVAVSDTGIGIPPEALDRVFDRFYQVDASSTRTGEGTGIGLALSKELALRMDGDLTVRSTPGEGSTFILSVPMLRSADTVRWVPSDAEVPPFDAFGAPATPDTSINPDAQGLVALLIEDNADLRQFIAHSLSGTWQVVEASNGEEGEKKALDLLPDVIVSDVMMPKKDGFSVLETLKNNELTAHIPIIFLTAKADIESKLKGLRHGADDYLSKPFSTEELLARMDNLVALRRHLRAALARQPLATLDMAPPTDREATLSEPDRDFLRRFNLLIEQHIGDEQFSIEDFAAQMAISRMQLHRKLTALTDQSATAYIRNYRLERAMQLLKNREGNVSEVSLLVGFGSEKYFSTAFKEKFGVSPSQV